LHHYLNFFGPVRFFFLNAKFYTKSEELYHVASLKMSDLSDSLHTFSLLYSDGKKEIDNGSDVLPFKTLESFEPFAQNLLTRQSSSSTNALLWLAYTPFLLDEAMKNKWENYSRSHLHEWIDPSHDNLDQPLSDTTIWHYPDNANATTAMMTTRATVMTMNEPLPPYAPLWQMSTFPMSDPSSMINYDMESDKAYSSARQQMMLHSKTTVWSVLVGQEWNLSSPLPLRSPSSNNRTDFLNDTQADNTYGTTTLVAPHSWVLHPIWETAELSSSQKSSSPPNMVGAILSMVSWETFWADVSVSLKVAIGFCGL
jgi:hypothetical protein